MKKIFITLSLFLFSQILFAKVDYIYDFSLKYRPIYASPQIDYNMYFDFFSKNEPAIQKSNDQNTTLQNDDNVNSSTEGMELKKQDFDSNLYNNKLYHKNSGFTNYIGFSAGLGFMPPAKKNFLYFNLRLSDKMMFNSHHGLVISADFQTFLDWIEIYAEVEYIYNFDDKFGINISLMSILPVRYFAPFNQKGNFGDLLGITLLSFYDFGSIGIHWKF